MITLVFYVTYFVPTLDIPAFYTMYFYAMSPRSPFCTLIVMCTLRIILSVLGSPYCSLWYFPKVFLTSNLILQCQITCYHPVEELCH